MMSILRNLKNRKRVASSLIIASALIALSIGGMSSAVRAGDEGSGLAAPIEGTWILTIHRVNEGITFSALQSFAAGGVTVATGTIDRTPPPPISPLLGSWRRMGHNSFTATICFFFFDDEGKALGMFKTPMTLQVVDENKLAGSGTGFACDINGDNCEDVHSAITVTGKRLIAGRV